MVPVIRNAEALSFLEVEQRLTELGNKVCYNFSLSHTHTHTLTRTLTHSDLSLQVMGIYHIFIIDLFFTTFRLVTTL